MLIKQKKFSNKCFFDFKDEFLSYTIEDSDSKNKFNIQYIDIPSDELNLAEIEEKTAYFKYVSIFMLIYATATYFFQINYILFPIILSGIFYFLYLFSKTSFKIIQTEKGSIFIMDNKQKDLIFEMIAQKRKLQLKSLHYYVDKDSSIQKETDKFNWLFNQEIISENEYIEKINEMNNYFNKEKGITTI